MKEEELQKMKENYTNLKKVKKEILSLQKEFEELGCHPIVKRYFEVQEELKRYQYYISQGVEKKTDQELIKKAADSVRVTEVNPIYVYLEIDHNLKGYPKGDYKKYANIEAEFGSKEFVKCIPISECEKFEEENIVLYPPINMRNFAYYILIRHMYFENAIRYGEKRALKKVLYKRHMQRTSKKKREDNKEA